MNTKQMLNEIRKGKRVAENISAYADKYLDSSYQYAMHRMALQYYTLYETVQEAGVDTEEADSVLDELHACVKAMLENDGSLTVERISALRNDIIRKMRVLTFYTDILQVYEYILNRVEPKYIEDDTLKQFNDVEDFTAKLNQFIYGVQDNLVINERIKDVIAQLPIRMTKAKFFEYLSNSIDLYKKADEEALEGFLYMIRSCSMLDRPEGMEDYFEAYRKLADELSRIEYDKLTKEEYKEITTRLGIAAEEIRVIIDLYLSIQEIVNDLYITILTLPRLQMKKHAILDTLKHILSVLNEMFLTDSSAQIPDEITGRLSITEGHQESLQTECDLLEAAYDEIYVSNREAVKACGRAEDFKIFPVLARLMSSSVFAELTDEEGSRPVTEESLTKAKDSLILEYTELFKNNSKMVNRAVMAAALGKMPVIFNTAQELFDYTEQSLLRCRDENERKAAMNILDSIMLEG